MRKEGFWLEQRCNDVENYLIERGRRKDFELQSGSPESTRIRAPRPRRTPRVRPAQKAPRLRKAPSAARPRREERPQERRFVT